MPPIYGGAAARGDIPVSSGGRFYPPSGCPHGWMGAPCPYCRRGLSSLGTAEAMSPTVLGRVGSGYGERVSSRTGNRTFHAGWDFVAPRGTPIYAAAGGVVDLFAHERPGGAMRGYGNAVVVRHDDGTWALYAHLSRADVAQGDPITEGQQIGLAGNTTNGQFPRMPPHLHFEIRHAKPDGSSPFPGGYGTFNLDPKDWFARKGMVIGNRSGRPPGTLIPSPSGPVSGLDGLEGAATPKWWETVFIQRAPEGETYKPGVDYAEMGGLWDWSGIIAGGLLFNGVYALLYGKLPIIRAGRRR